MRSEIDTLTLAATLNQTVDAYGSQEAYVGPDGRFTWEQIAEGSRQIAAALIAAGIKKGDHVGLLLGNSAAWIQLFLGIGSIGAVTVPVNTRFKSEELQFCLKRADVRLLIFEDEFLRIDFCKLVEGAEPAINNQLPGSELPQLYKAVMLGDHRAAPKGCESFADFLSSGAGVSNTELLQYAEGVNKDDVLLIQYTSGTTSFPKGVMLSHANMLLDAKAVAKRMGVRHDDRYFSIRPFFHVAGSTLSILVSINTGCCLLTLPKFDVSLNLEILHGQK